MIKLDKNIILVGLEAATKEEVIKSLTQKMAEHGYVENDYADYVIKREENYPTGLPSEGVMTAVPHAFCENIYKTGVGVASLAKPVAFQNMANKDESLAVELVFLMANASGESEHLDGLQELMRCFCKEQMLLDLKNAKSSDELVAIFENADKYPSDEDDEDF